MVPIVNSNVIVNKELVIVLMEGAHVFQDGQEITAVKVNMWYLVMN